MEEKTPQNLTTLFGNLEITDQVQLDTLLYTMDKSVATLFLLQAVQFAYQRGAYTLLECEVISKCVRVLESKSAQ